METTPWFQALGVGLLLVLVSALFCYLSSRYSKSLNRADGCLVLLFAVVGFVFGVAGFVCVCLGLFGWF